MRPMDTVHVGGFHEALKGWTDQRFISRDDIETAAMFILYLVNLLEYRGWDLYGHTYTQKGRMGCLVVKADHEGTPHVAFTNARTPIASMRIFLRRLETDTLEWRRDKYRS